MILNLEDNFLVVEVVQVHGRAGTANTGGGGGGAAEQCAPSGRDGGAGGSGVVIIRYKFQN